MRNSPRETATPTRDITLDPRAVEPVIEPAPRVPFSPAERPEKIARGILEDEFANARATVAAH
jgi:hypothetical protein